jgi:biotin transport system substrate-specific component
MGNMKKLIAVPLFAAMTAVGGYIAIPLPWTPVPIVLQNFFVFLTGLVLGAKGGAAAIGLFLLAGALGFPVFAGGTGGIGRFVGPTGGYLLSYAAAAWAAGFIASRGRKKPIQDTGQTPDEAAPDANAKAPAPDADTAGRKKALRFFLSRDFLAALTACVLVYSLGLPWFKAVLGWDWPATLAGGLFPYIPGDLLKAAGAAALAPVFRKFLEAEGIGKNV